MPTKSHCHSGTASLSLLSLSITKSLFMFLSANAQLGCSRVIGSCHPHGRYRLYSGLLKSFFASPNYSGPLESEDGRISLSLYLSVSLKKKSFFRTEFVRERIPICLFYFSRNTCIGQDCTRLKMELGTPYESPTWVTRAQATRPIFCCLPGHIGWALKQLGLKLVF